MKYIGAAFLFIFFVVKETRWLLELLEIKIINPYILLTVLGLIYIGAYCVLLIKERIRPNRIIWMWLSYLTYQFIVVTINFYWLRSYFSVYEYIVIISTHIISIAMFIIATNNNIYDMISKHRKIILWVLIIMLLMPQAAKFYLNSYTNFSLKETLINSLRYMFYYANLVNPALASSHGIDYQSFGDSMVLFTFLLLPYLERERWRICLLGLMTLTVYMLTSKAAVIGVTVSLFFTALYSMAKRKLYTGRYFTALMVGVLLFIPVLFLNQGLYNAISPQRIVTLLTQNRSFSSRAEISDFNKISRPPRLLYGNFKHEVQEGRIGRYNHNIVDVIDQFGIFIFTLHLIFLLYLLIKILFLPDSQQESFWVRADMLYIVYWLVLLFIIRTPVGNAVESFIIGYCCREIIISKKQV